MAVKRTDGKTKTDEETGGRSKTENDGKKRGGDLSINDQLEKYNNLGFVSSKDSDQSGHPLGLIRVFTVHMKKA